MGGNRHLSDVMPTLMLTLQNKSLTLSVYRPSNDMRRVVFLRCFMLCATAVCEMRHFVDWVFDRLLHNKLEINETSCDIRISQITLTVAWQQGELNLF